MNARMYVQDLIETDEMPTVKHGWAMVFASPEAAAVDFDPTATLENSWNTKWGEHFVFHGSIQGRYIVRPWLEWEDEYSAEWDDVVPMGHIAGWLVDKWLDHLLTA